METLSIKELAPYLPYSIKVVMEGKICNVAWMSTKNIAVHRPGGIGDYKKIRWKYAHLNIKPILNPLSDLPNGHVDYIYFAIIGTDNDMYGSRDEFENTLFELLGDPIHLPVLVYNYLLEKHFDLFNLIKIGKAIDLNTIKETVK